MQRASCATSDTGSRCKIPVNFLYNEHLCCPLDQLLLQQEGTQLRCESGHHFDIARQGYVNLLGAADKRSQDPGVAL